MLKTHSTYSFNRKGAAATRTTLTHSFETSRTGRALSDSLCGRIRQENAQDADVGQDDAPTCALCAKRDRRSKQHANDGPFMLKSMLQF